MSSWPSLWDGSLDILRHLTQGAMIIKRMFTTIFGDDNTSLGKNNKNYFESFNLGQGHQNIIEALGKAQKFNIWLPQIKFIGTLSISMKLCSSTGCGSNKEWSVYVEGGILSLWPISKKCVVLFPITLVASKIICLNHISPTSKRRISAEFFDQASGMRFKISFIQKSCCTSKSYTFGRSLTFQKIAKSVFGRLLSFVGAKAPKIILKRHKVSSSGVFYLLNSDTICDV